MFLSVVRSFVLSVCEQDYCKSNQPISVKLDVMIRPTSRKNWLTFGGDAVPDTHTVSLCHFPHHCEIGDFMRFISISHTVTGRFSRHWWESSFVKYRTALSPQPTPLATLVLFSTNTLPSRIKSLHFLSLATITQSWTWVHFGKSNPTQSISWLTQSNSIRGLIRNSGFESRIVSLRLDALAEVCAVWAQSTCYYCFISFNDKTEGPEGH